MLAALVGASPPGPLGCLTFKRQVGGTHAAPATCDQVACTGPSELRQGRRMCLVHRMRRSRAVAVTMAIAARCCLEGARPEHV